MKNPRSTLLFAGGLIGLGVETFYSLQYGKTPDSGLLVLFASMIGLPAFLSLDTKDKDKDDDNRDRRPPRRGSSDDDDDRQDTPAAK